MDSSGSSKPKKESSDDEKVTPAQEFMDSDEVGKKAKLSNMASVMEMDSILPEKLSSWDKDTTTMVLEKALSMCGIPTTATGEATVEEKQETLELQIKALKEKMERNAKLLEAHHKAKEEYNQEIAEQNERRQHWEEIQQEVNTLRERFGEEDPDVLRSQEIIDEAFRHIQKMQDYLDNYEFPLKED